MDLIESGVVDHHIRVHYLMCFCWCYVIVDGHVYMAADDALGVAAAAAWLSVFEQP